jgi:transposase-like protein
MKGWSATRRCTSRSACAPTAPRKFSAFGSNEGAKFWLRVINELKNRGVEDVLIAVVDGLKGFPEAITAVFPQATVQTCIVHLLRHSLDFVSWKDRKPVAAALKEIYRFIARSTPTPAKPH